MSPAAAPFTLPARYRLQGPVASGGMASVWAARDEVLGRDVAVKVLAEHLGEDESARARFEREARAAAGLSSHPNVVTIFDVGEHAGRSFMVMELRKGGTIADALRRGRPEPQRALEWLRDAAEAIDAAHERGIVHRDIKPANLLLDERGRLAVADFGIARVAEDPALTQTGIVLGTAAYISPEQAVGDQATPASDRYSLAVVAFELLTGSKPFQAEHFAAQARAHVEEPPPSARERAPGLPPAVDDVLRRGLAKQPDERWPSAVALVDALERALAPAREPTAPTRPVAAAPRRPVAAAPPSRRRRSSRLPLLAAVLALLAVAAGALAIATSGDGGEEAPAPAQRDEPQATETPAGEGGEPAPEPAPEEDASEQPAPETADPAALNAQGFELFQQERYAEAVPYLERAVAACGEGGALDPCGYAYYNLGAALNRSGRPAEAIPYLETRLELWPDDQRDVVERELEAAEEAADRGADDDDRGNGNNGRGRSRGRGG